MPMDLVYLSGNYYSKNLLYNWQEFSSFHSKCLCWFDFLLKQITRFALNAYFCTFGLCFDSWPSLGI